jgi:mono/diheme cytochrome c family protein
MRPLGKIIQRGILPLMSLALVVISACTGLSGEPEIVSTLRPRPTIASFTLDAEQRNIENGAVIYAQNCTRCHGITGKGDGELAITGQLPVTLIDFTDPQAVQGKTPEEWFRIIYNGKLENLMPPWSIANGGSLTDDQIGDVTLFLFELADNGESMPEATADVESLAPITTPDADATADVEALAPITTPDAEATANSEATLSPESTPLVVASANTGLVSGLVVNGTEGGSVPADLPVKLYSSTGTGDSLVAETALNPDGTFQFSDVALSHGQEFYVTVGYLGGFFVSQILTPDSGSNLLDLPVTIYETTYDPQAIRVTNILTYANVIDDTLDVVQVIEFANITDKLYVQVVDEVVSALMVGLPAGAIFNDVTGGRFRLSDDGRTVTDSRPVFPLASQETAHTLHFAYSLPYDGDVTIEQTFPYLVDGELDVLIQQDGLSVDGDGFQSRGSRMIAEGIFANFGATLSLMPQTPIRFSVSGTVILPPLAESSTDAPNLPLAIILVGAGVLSIAVAGIIFIQDKRENAKPVPDAKEQINLLMKQIADLDIQHKDGKISDEVHVARRDKLKAQLTKLMKDLKSV